MIWMYEYLTLRERDSHRMSTLNFAGFTAAALEQLLLYWPKITEIAVCDDKLMIRWKLIISCYAHGFRVNEIERWLHRYLTHNFFQWTCLTCYITLL